MVVSFFGRRTSLNTLETFLTCMSLPGYIWVTTTIVHQRALHKNEIANRSRQTKGLQLLDHFRPHIRVRTSLSEL